MNALSPSVPVTRRFSLALFRRPHGAWLLALFCTACESGSPSAVSPGASPSAAPAPGGAAPDNAGAPAAGGGSVARFGAALEPGGAGREHLAVVPLATLLSNPTAYANQTVTTEGKVQRACSRKGCWMEIGSGEDACRVTFKDYGFFVPTDSAGAFAKIQGRLDTRNVEAAAVQHLESEGARFHNKKPDGSATEVRLIASAVELTR
jgi:hypothetical protein